MDASLDHANLAACRCGLVALHIEGPPLAHVACYCGSCQEAGRLIGQLPGAWPVLGLDGGTDYLLFRKDRLRCTQGSERLEELRLRPDSPTRRIVAGCCNTAICLDFRKGHWLTLYRSQVGGEVPPLQMRVMTAERREGVALPRDVPAYRGHAGKLMWKLLATWAAMGFRVPNVSGIPEQPRPVHVGTSDE